MEYKLFQTAKHEKIILFENRPQQDSNCLNNYLMMISTGYLGPSDRP